MPNLVDPGGEGEGGGKLKALTIGYDHSLFLVHCLLLLLVKCVFLVYIPFFLS